MVHCGMWRAAALLSKIAKAPMGCGEAARLQIQLNFAKLDGTSESIFMLKGCELHAHDM